MGVGVGGLHCGAAEIITEDRRALGWPAPSGSVRQQSQVGKGNSQKAREF